MDGWGVSSGGGPVWSADRTAAVSLRGRDSTAKKPYKTMGVTLSRVKGMKESRLWFLEDLRFVHPLGAFRAQELCESRGGRPGLPSLIILRFLWT